MVRGKGINGTVTPEILRESAPMAGRAMVKCLGNDGDLSSNFTDYCCMFAISKIN